VPLASRVVLRRFAPDDVPDLHAYLSQPAAVEFEPCRALLRELFVDRSAHRVVAHCDPRNTRSWALLERLGFRREAHLRAAASFAVDDAGNPVWHDAFGYALLSDEWERAAVG
jgi:RimJ/RimL family protein N-acetyltransferase